MLDIKVADKATMNDNKIGASDLGELRFLLIIFKWLRVGVAVRLKFKKYQNFRSKL